MYFAKYKNLMIMCDPNTDVKSELLEMLLWNLWLKQSWEYGTAFMYWFVIN